MIKCFVPELSACASWLSLRLTICSVILLKFTIILRCCMKMFVAVPDIATYLHAVSHQQWFKTEGPWTLQARNYSDVWLSAHLISNKLGKCWTNQITGSSHSTKLSVWIWKCVLIVTHKTHSHSKVHDSTQCCGRLYGLQWKMEAR